MVELVYKFNESLPRVFENVSWPLKCHSNFWGVITIASYIYKWTPGPITDGVIVLGTERQRI